MLVPLVPRTDISMEATSTSTQALSKATFECKLCDSTFTSADELREHLRGHISKVATDRDRRARRQSPRPPPSESADQGAPLPLPNGSLAPFKCTAEGCQYTTDDRGRFTEHLGSHRETNDCGCVFCGEAFNGTAALVQHIVTSHQQRAFQCGMCNYSAAQPLYLVLHCRWYHQEIGPFMMTCKNAELRAPELTPRPPERAHCSVEPYRCGVDDCGFKTINPGTLKRHLTSVHSNFEKFDCFVCRVSASSPKALLEHFLQHNLGAVICGLCQHYELSSLKAMLRHHCDHHPDGSLQILFRDRQLLMKFEQFVGEFGRMARYLPQPPPCAQESGPRRSSRISLMARKRYLPSPDTCSEEEQTRGSSSFHNCKSCTDLEAPIPQSSSYTTQYRRSAGQSHEPALYVVGLEEQPKRIPLSVFTLYYNIDARVVVKGSERCRASQYLCNL